MPGNIWREGNISREILQKDLMTIVKFRFDDFDDGGTDKESRMNKRKWQNRIFTRLLVPTIDANFIVSSKHKMVKGLISVYT